MKKILFLNGLLIKNNYGLSKYNYISDRISVNVVGIDLSEKMLEAAKKAIPEGVFYRHTIQDFGSDKQFDAVILEFGLPYLDCEQTEECINNAISLTGNGKFLYVSFMNGDGSGYEKTSFGGDNQFFIYYHDKAKIRDLITRHGLTIIKEYNLEYTEPDGGATEDVVLVAQNELKP